MMRPHRSRIIVSSTCWHARNAPVRLAASTASQSSFFMRSARPSLAMAALLTRMSTLPALANASLMDSGEAMSIWTQVELGIVADAASSLAVSRAARTTRAPACASARAHASPMPRLAPVTRAVLFVIIFNDSLWLMPASAILSEPSKSTVS